MRSGRPVQYRDAARRTWARGVSTVYTNDEAGRLVGIGYTNGTPDVVFVYDRAGRPVRASSSVAAYGFRYNDCGRLDSETNSVADAILIRSYDAFGRPSGLSLASDYEVEYGYDPAGRFTAVTGTVASATSVANYGYVADSDLLAGYTSHVAGSSASLNVSRGYDNLGRTLFVSNTVGGTTVSAYGYQYNTANQRTRIDVGGSATPLSGSWWEHGYDSLGQVTNSVRRLADSTAVSGQRFGYVFDDIGNRVLAEGSDVASAETYAANDLNQYTQRSVPRRVDVLGSAHSNALVTVRSALAVGGATNYARAMRQGTYFHGVAPVPTNAAAQLGLDVFAVLGGVGTNGEDAVSVESGVRSVAPDPQVFTYDQDGNLLSDGIFVYAWDAENRLTLASNATVKVAFAYDPLGRRVSKTVHEWDTDHWSPLTDRSFVYDGWALIRESSTTVTNLYVYGQDLSGTMQGAGTIGGLLFADLNGEAALYAYDANGNVTDLIGPDGAVRARYEYSPFGETLIQTGPLASVNPFRFSTKYLDAETGCYYYGYRLYIPPLGRWASRDPLGEWSARNLHSLLGNRPIGQVDLLGLMNMVDPPWGGGAFGIPVQGGGGFWSPEAPSGPSALQRRLARLLVDIFGAQGSIDEVIFTHFATGGGRQLSIPSSEVVNLVNLSLSYFRGGTEAIADACRHCKVEGFVGGCDVDDVSGALGAITFATEGAIESDGRTWKYDGSVWPINEHFDFRPLLTSRRRLDGNAATVLGQLLSWFTPAQTFPIVFEGTVRWKTQGHCP